MSPKSAKSVYFQMPPSFSRWAKDDELSVMEYFSKHVESCNKCDYRRLAENRSIFPSSLCDLGHAYARDITRYLYHYRGIVYSTYETTSGRVPVRVEIPRAFALGRQLLQAVELGLCLQRPLPARERLQGVTTQQRRSQTRRADRCDSIEAHRRRFSEQRYSSSNTENARSELARSNQPGEDGASTVIIERPNSVHIHLGRGAKVIM